MDIGDMLFSPNCALNERIARQIFDVLPERGPIMIIMDREDNFWVSNPEKFSEQNIGESFLRELCAKVDDGADPVVTQVDECSVIAAQLAAEQTRCGYVIIVLPQYNPESTLVNIDLIETILNQAGVIARLVENNSILNELQMKRLSSYTQIEASSN